MRYGRGPLGRGGGPAGVRDGLAVRDTGGAVRICRRIADALRGERAELARLETLDTGKPIGQALTDADVAARYFDFYANAVESLGGETIQQRPDRLAFTLREPYGVCGHIIPWNYPLQIAARTLAPALAAGNCCVLKPAEDAPLTSLRLAALAEEAGLPAGVLNVVPGYGEEAGAALAADPGVDRIAFTGSREVGEAVMTAAARNIVPVTLELGGKSPHVVLPDYDAARAVPQIVEAITEHAGQNCSAGSRLIVHRSVHDELVSALAERFRALRIGPGHRRSRHGAAHLREAACEGPRPPGRGPPGHRGRRRRGRARGSGVRGRLLRGAHDPRPGDAPAPRLQRGDLRPGPVRDGLRHARRGGRPGGTHHVRAGRRGLDLRRDHRPTGSPDGCGWARCS
ncbi:NAD/NADP-dependent betaine aldehyde dehydrogenase [Streptomyces rimosus subsp. rimosus]